MVAVVKKRKKIKKKITGQLCGVDGKSGQVYAKAALEAQADGAGKRYSLHILSNWLG